MVSIHTSIEPNVHPFPGYHKYFFIECARGSLIATNESTTLKL